MGRYLLCHNDSSPALYGTVNGQKHVNQYKDQFSGFKWLDCIVSL